VVLKGFIFCIFLWSAQGVAAAERVALLIGVDSYGAPSFALNNPVNDVVILDGALSELGFKVSRAINPDRAALDIAIDRFERDMHGADIALVFFAGHGVQIEGENHLLMSGFSTLTLDDVTRESLTLSELRDRFNRAAPRLGVIILDACRNNPFSASGATEKGLARSQGGAGLLIAYATDPGNVAFDGEGQNSIFTRAIADNISTPGVEARLMFGRVRQQVLRDSGGAQIPWVEEAVVGEFFFNAASVVRINQTSLQNEIIAWEEAGRLATVAGYQGFLLQFPEGMFAKVAQERITRIHDKGGVISGEAGNVRYQVTGADRPRMVAGLSLLGFLSEGGTRGISDAALSDALVRYSALADTDGQAITPDAVYRDAAQLAVILAAQPSQRIRTDLTALSGIEKTLKIAKSAVEQLEEMAQQNAEAAALLPEAQADIAAIYIARETVLVRLDENRSHYTRLLERAGTHFAPYLDYAMIGLTSSASRSTNLGRDAAVFLDHVAEINLSEKKGSYSWLLDFLPEA
jgi:hypothetical protein